MPPRTLLSSEQRTRLSSIPTYAAEMTRHYVLDADDLALIGARRRAENRLGFAVQLCVLRHPGRVLDPLESPPAPMLAFIARQIGVDTAPFGEYARRAETRREHLLELHTLLHLRSFGLADWRTSLRVGADAAWATDRGEPIVQAMLAHLRANGVLLPAAAVLERIGLAARARARKKTFETLAAGLSDSERDTLTGLLAVDPELRRSRFAWLDRSAHQRALHRYRRSDRSRVRPLPSVGLPVRAPDQGSEGPQALYSREAQHLAVAGAIDRRHGRYSGDPWAMDGSHAARAPQAVASLDLSCAPRPPEAVGAKGAPTDRPRLRRVEQRAVRWRKGLPIDPRLENGRMASPGAELKNASTQEDDMTSHQIG